MKKIGSFLLTLITIFTLVGCGNSSSNKDLADYIDNYDEVVNIIETVLGKDEITIKQYSNPDFEQNIAENNATLEQFGNGTYYAEVDGIQFNISCEDHIACYVYYNDGSKSLARYHSIETPSFEKIMEERQREMKEQGIITTNNETTVLK